MITGKTASGVRLALLTTALLLGLGLATASAQDAAKALRDKIAEGEQLANRLCAACHLTPAATVSGQGGVPSLRMIANYQGQTGTRIGGALTMPPHAMPDMSLTREEIIALVAYLDTLREDRTTPLLEPVEERDDRPGLPKRG